MSIKPDLRLIDRLGRLQLAARRLGFELRIVNAEPALVELVDLCGLAGELGVEVQRHPEKREEALGVEEERDVRDPSL